MYKINYNQIGGMIKCPNCDFKSSDFFNKMIPHFRDFGHGDVEKNNQPFYKHCQIFVNLKLNDIGMINKLIQIRRNARKKVVTTGTFNSEENDAKIEYHVTLLQIYVNIRHSMFRRFLGNKNELMDIINKNFLAAFGNESLIPSKLKKLGDKFIVLNLGIDDKTFQKYVQAKRDFYGELNKILGTQKPRYEVSSYFDKDKKVTGLRFFFGDEPFLFIKDHYLTKNDANGRPKNNFIPHISVLNLQDTGTDIKDEQISEFKEGVEISNPIKINGKFSIKSNISTHNKNIDEKFLLSADKVGNDEFFVKLAFKEDYFVNYLVHLIKSCNS